MNLTTDELVNGAGLRFCGHVEEDLERVECRHGAQRSLGIPQIKDMREEEQEKGSLLALLKWACLEYQVSKGKEKSSYRKGL